MKTDRKAKCLKCGAPNDEPSDSVPSVKVRIGVTISVSHFQRKFWVANGGCGAQTAGGKFCGGCGPVVMDQLLELGLVEMDPLEPKLAKLERRAQKAREKAREKAERDERWERERAERVAREAARPPPVPVYGLFAQAQERRERRQKRLRKKK